MAGVVIWGPFFNIFSRFLHAVAGAVHPLGDPASADPLAVALGVRSFRAPRSSGLGGRHGEQGKDVPVGTRGFTGNSRHPWRQ